MAIWFLSIAVLGIGGIAKHPAVLWAINPWYGLSYLFSHGIGGFLVLGGVFLCVTGAEALYADMGHFGARPIRLAWSAVWISNLVLNYAGQAALVLHGEPTSGNIFFRLCPSALLIPLVVLSTIATIIASQSIITGAFSMTRQAIQLGWLPRLQITQTAAEGYGQIYVGVVNWLLMIVTIGLTIAFGKSDNLAGTYGIAVSATMLITSALLFIAMREIWHWNICRCGGTRWCFPHCRYGIFHRKSHESCGRRVCAITARRDRLFYHGSLARRCYGSFETYPRERCTDRHLYGENSERPSSACAGNCCVPNANGA